MTGTTLTRILTRPIFPSYIGYFLYLNDIKVCSKLFMKLFQNFRVRNFNQRYPARHIHIFASGRRFWCTLLLPTKAILFTSMLELASTSYRLMSVQLNSYLRYSMWPQVESGHVHTYMLLTYHMNGTVWYPITLERTEERCIANYL